MSNMEKLYNGPVFTIINILQLQCLKVTSPNTDQRPLTIKWI